MKLRETERSQWLVCTCCEPSVGKSHPEVGKNQREICKTENHICIRLDVTLSLGHENKESSKRKLLTWHFVSHGKKNRAAGEKKREYVGSSSQCTPGTDSLHSPPPQTPSPASRQETRCMWAHITQEGPRWFCKWITRGKPSDSLSLLVSGVSSG